MLSEGRTNSNDWMNATDAKGCTLDKRKAIFFSQSYVKMVLSVSEGRTSHAGAGAALGGPWLSRLLSQTFCVAPSKPEI